MDNPNTGKIRNNSKADKGGDKNKKSVKDYHAKFKETCTGKTLRRANYAAVCLLLLMWILRFVYMGDGEIKPQSYSAVQFFIVSIFQGCLIAILAMSMYPDKQHRTRVQIRMQMRCLDFRFGRGVLIFYLAIMLCEVQSHGEVAYGVFACLIAIVDMYQGFDSFRKFVRSSGQEQERDIADESNQEMDEESQSQQSQLQMQDRYGQVMTDSSRQVNEIHLEMDQDKQGGLKDPQDQLAGGDKYVDRQAKNKEISLDSEAGMASQASSNKSRKKKKKAEVDAVQLDDGNGNDRMQNYNQSNEIAVGIPVQQEQHSVQALVNQVNQQVDHQAAPNQSNFQVNQPDKAGYQNENQ